MKISPQEMRHIIREEARKMMLESEKKAILNEMRGLERMVHAKVNPKMKSAIEISSKAIMGKINSEQAKKTVQELSLNGFLNASKQEIEHKLKEMLHINESTSNETWSKSKVHNWLLGSGLGSNTAALVAAILNKMPEKVGSDSGTLLGLIAVAIEAIASNIATSSM